MQKQFTEKAKKALTLASKAAGRLHQNYVGSEHILVGLLQENTGVAAQVLMENGVDAKKVIDNQKHKAYIDLKDMEGSLTEEEKTVARLLSGGAMHMDVLAEKLQTSASRLLPLMTRLQIKGIVCQIACGVYELAEK